nr:hypothetical protein [Tanacetum cinerariifolium]
HDGPAGHLLRNARRATAEPRRARKRTQGARYSAGRHLRRRQQAPAAADLLGNPDGTGVFRVHPAKGRRRLRRGQLQGAVRIDRAR